MKKQNQFSFWKKNKAAAKAVSAISLIALVFSLNLVPLTYSVVNAQEVSESTTVVAESRAVSVSNVSSSDSQSEENSSEEDGDLETKENNESNGKPGVEVEAKSSASASSVSNVNVNVNVNTSTNVNRNSNSNRDIDDGISRECRQADFDDNGTIDTRDIIAFLNAHASDDPKADINGDEEVNEVDVFAFLTLWDDCSDSGSLSMCFAPFNGGEVDQQGISADSNLQSVLNEYADSNDEENLDAVDDQKNYRYWDVNVSGSMGSSNLTCENTADWDGNGTIDTRDIIDYLNDWNAAEDNEADLNGDNQTNAFDFYIFLSLWKACDAGDDIVIGDGEMEVELISDESSSPIAFGYYINGDLDTFTPVFEAGNHSDYEAPELEEGEDANFSAPYFADGSFTDSVGFAIAVDGGMVGEDQVFATDRDLNGNGQTQVLVYDFTENQFVLAFEDSEVSNNEGGFDDIVVRITAKTCEGDDNGGGDGDLDAPTLVSPENNSFVNGSSITSVWNAVQGAVEYVFQRLAPNGDVELSVETNKTNITHTDLEEQIYLWRVKAENVDEDSNWSETWKVTVDNTAPTTTTNLISGSSFTTNIPVSGTTTDNWNVRSVIFSQATSDGATCGDFSDISTLTLDNSSSTATWSHTLTPSQTGTYCFKAEGVDFAGNRGTSTAAVNISFTSTSGNGDGGNGGGDGGNNNDDDDNGGGSSGGGYWGGGSGGRVLGSSTEDLSDLEAQLQAAREQLLRLLEQRLRDLQAQLDGMNGGPSFAGGTSGNGQVLGVAEAQEIPGEEEEIIDEEILEDATTTATETPEVSPDDTNWGRVILWILFIIILIILLWLALRRKKTTSQ